LIPSRNGGPIPAERILLQDAGEQALVEVLEQLREKFGTIGAFIHLHPSFPFNLFDAQRFAEAEKQLLKAVFMLAKHLAQPLMEAGAAHRSIFLTVTRSNGMLGFEPEKTTSPVAGGLHGLVKTAAIEWHPVFCRAIDLASDLDAVEAAGRILAEMADADCRRHEIGCTPGSRFTLVAEEDPVDLSGISGIDTESVFLVTGGGKGVTAACGVEMAWRFGCRFILLGRSELQNSEPAWAAGCEEDAELKRRCMEAMKAAGEKPTPMKIAKKLKIVLSDREIRRTMAGIQQAGGRAVYLPVDIMDSASLQAALQPATEQLGSITGIIHGAGVLADAIIAKKAEADIEAVYGTKVSGLNSILNAVSLEKLSHLVLFASAAGFYGNEAQSDYAAANEILNKFAHQFKQQFPTCHVIAFNWGPWDGGMVTPELRRIFKQRNIEIIPVPVGAGIMAEGLDAACRETPQVVIGSSMTQPGKQDEQLKSWRISSRLRLQDNPFLADHTIGQDPVLPLIAAVSWMVDSCAGLYPGYFLHSVENARVFKGVIFSSDITEKNFDLEIRELEKNEMKGVVRFDVKVSSAGPGKKPVFHYGSQVLLSREPAAPSVMPVPAPLQTEEAVSYYSNGTLFHGPVFRNIRGLVEISAERLVLRCRAPQIPEKTRGRLAGELFNIFAEDACLQALLVWVRHFHKAGSLPLNIGKAEFFKPIGFESDFLVTLTPEVSRASKFTATVIAHAPTGDVYSRFSGAEVTISKNLDGKFQPDC